MVPRSRFTPRKVLLVGIVIVAGTALGALLELALAHLAEAARISGITASAWAGPAQAKEASSLNQVIDNLRNVIVGLLVALATLFLTVGGVRYILAGGDPGEVEAAKKTLRYAAMGYGIAVLAPLLVSILKGIVGA
ncbi:pilin [Nonomuraea angiospora]|uniref:pilin n=1 Tax=Nonomuraea angiospora TaxID=46172 RepID=UPI003325B735